VSATAAGSRLGDAAVTGLAGQAAGGHVPTMRIANMVGHPKQLVERRLGLARDELQQCLFFGRLRQGFRMAAFTELERGQPTVLAGGEVLVAARAFQSDVMRLGD
jgi:hypothetical protein